MKIPARPHDYPQEKYEKWRAYLEHMKKDQEVNEDALSVLLQFPPWARVHLKGREGSFLVWKMTPTQKRIHVVPAPG